MNRAANAIGLTLAVWLAGTLTAAAYPVGPSLTLDELIAQADFIGKVTAGESKPVADPWFDAVQSFGPVQTQLKVLATYKGKAGGEEVGFRHYAASAEGLRSPGYMPQTYRFDRGRTYIVFAAKADKDGVFRQLWKSHTAQEDQGLFLAADLQPRTDQPIKEVIFAELTGLLRSEKTDDVKYGLSHLDLLSGGTYHGQQDFDREEVLDSVKRLLGHKDNEVVAAAIGVMGSNNPYMSADFAPGWLATIGKGDIPGFGTWDRSRENLGGKLYWKQLAAIVDSPAPASIRARAIRALGRAEEPAILPLAQRWVSDADPLVRQAAAVLLADFRGEVDPAMMVKLAADAQPAVRIGAAQAVGFGQFKELIPQLARLLTDADAGVQSAAAMSLLSFSLDESREVLKANLKHPQFHSLFVNALAREDAGAFLDELAEIIKRKKEPEQFWGGSIPWGVSWDLLFHHVQRQPAADVRGGKFDKMLDALEYPASGDAAGPSYYSSSEPRDLYALYVQRGMSDRAAKFRALAKKNITYDIDYYFKMVDQNPQQYQRQ
jgi:HEAT repeat protein